MSRPGRALVDLEALRHNYRLARQMHGGQALAVLKANAYGHGTVRCAQALQPLADGFAVAFLDEARELRAAGMGGPLLVLEGLFDAEEWLSAQALDVWVVVHHAEQLRMLAQAPVTVPLQVWLKVDSGMGRAGFAPADVATAYATLQASGKVSDIVLMSHFARADEPASHATALQIATFDSATVGLAGPRSLCNSAGLLAWPEARRDWGRPGIVLYGADPLPAPGAAPLRPVMALHSQVFATRTLQVGQPLGYGAHFVAPRTTRVGLVAMGYADGYPRHAPAGTPVAVDGAPTHLIGRVSMDMLTIDLTDLPQAGIGSAVELWGAQVTVNEVAHCAGTIAYELLCNVKRVPLVYSE